MPPKAKMYPYKGKMLYAPEIAEKTGLNIQTVYRRIQTGKPLEDRKNNTCFFQGKVRTLQEVSDMTGLAVSGVRNKLLQGKPIKLLPPYAGKKYNFHGEMRTLKEISKLTGLKLVTVYQRIYHNKPFDDVYRHHKTKTCPCCNETKEISNFGKEGNNIKGNPLFRGECKDCRNKRRRKS